MLGEMFHLDQRSPNIAKHDTRFPDKVCKRPNISSDMISDQMLDQKLDDDVIIIYFQNFHILTRWSGGAP